MTTAVHPCLPETPQEPTIADSALMTDAAAGLSVVIRLFDRELDGKALDALRSTDTLSFLDGLFDSAAATEALAELRASLASIPHSPSEDVLDILAADYADIFLTHVYRAAPSASVWLSEDHTERNEPMFEARRWYDHWGIAVPNWRERADDHIVPMLQFVSFLLENGSAAAAADAAVFMDRQMGPWVGDFLGRVSARAETPLYRAAALLAGAVLAEIRSELTRITGIVEDIPPPPKRADVVPDETAFLPGVTPSW